VFSESPNSNPESWQTHAANRGRRSNEWRCAAKQAQGGWKKVNEANKQNPRLDRWADTCFLFPAAVWLAVETTFQQEPTMHSVFEE
jgi:hypothetical protein